MQRVNVLIFAIMLPFLGYALPVNNPEIASLACDGVFFTSSNYATPMMTCDTLSVRVGYYGDFIFNNYMQVKVRDSSIRMTRIFTNAGEIDFNLWNRIEAFGVLGVSNVVVQAPITNFNVSGSPVNSLVAIQTESYFAWSVGLRGTIWQCGRFALGLTGQYFSTNPQINFVQDFYHSVSRYLDDQSLHYHAWQGGLGISCEIPINACFSFLPYATFILSDAAIGMNNRQVVFSEQGVTIQLFDLQKERHIGYALGSTLLGGERVLITAEGRFAFEKALFLSIQMRL